MMLPSGLKQQNLSLGNETFDQFLGGGFLNRTLNLFERRGPTSKILDAVWTKSFASSSLTSGANLLIINFNTSAPLQSEAFLSTLPVVRKVKTELLYKDVRGKSATAKIKIAWRYSSRNASPADKLAETKEVDFGLQLTKEYSPDKIGSLRVINVPTEESFSLGNLLSQMSTEYLDLHKDTKSHNPTKVPMNIIIKDLLHPLSPMIDKPKKLHQFLYMMRCFVRTMDSGAILLSYDTDMCLDHSKIKQSIYNLVDCVVSFFTYETGQNVLLGYKHSEGTLDYIKVPKMNSFGLHFQRELSDWGYRFTRNHRYMVIDELNLPPCHDDEGESSASSIKNQCASDLTDIGNRKKELAQVSPLEEFKEIAQSIGKF